MGNLWGISLQKALSGEECVSFDFILTAEKRQRLAPGNQSGEGRQNRKIRRNYQRKCVKLQQLLYSQIYKIQLTKHIPTIFFNINSITVITWVIAAGYWINGLTRGLVADDSTHWLAITRRSRMEVFLCSLLRATKLHRFLSKGSNERIVFALQGTVRDSQRCRATSTSSSAPR